MNPQELLIENNILKEQLKLLQEQIEWFKRQLFGNRSEKIIENTNQLKLSLELEELITEAKELTVEAHTRKTLRQKGKDKITLPDN